MESNPDLSTPATVYALNLIGCRMAGGSPTQYVQVEAGCGWHGSLIAGCTFGESEASTGEDSAGLRSLGALSGTDGATLAGLSPSAAKSALGGGAPFSTPPPARSPVPARPARYRPLPAWSEVMWAPCRW